MAVPLLLLPFPLLSHSLLCSPHTCLPLPLPLLPSLHSVLASLGAEQETAPRTGCCNGTGTSLAPARPHVMSPRGVNQHAHIANECFTKVKNLMQIPSVIQLQSASFSHPFLPWSSLTAVPKLLPTTPAHVNALSSPAAGQGQP